jgi:hypothetical protein
LARILEGGEFSLVPFGAEFLADLAEKAQTVRIYLGKLLNRDDLMAVDAVQCEPALCGQIPVNRGKYREFFD